MMCAVPDSPFSYNSLVKAYQEREKYWQALAGRMAIIANALYQYIDERTLSDNDIDDVHSMYKEILEILPFDDEGEIG